MAEPLRLPTAEEMTKIEAAVRSMIPWDTGDGHLAIWASAAAFFFIAVTTVGYLSAGVATLIYKLALWLLADRSKRDPEEVRAKLPVEAGTWKPSPDWAPPVIIETKPEAPGNSLRVARVE